MKIAFVNYTDLAGARFNGHDLQRYLNQCGIEAKQFVFQRDGCEPNTIEIVRQSSTRETMRNSICSLEKSLGLSSVLYPFGEALKQDPAFLSADLVHFQLIQSRYFSLYSFRDLVNMQPSVWTIHDAWACTGHCRYPLECENWRNGCKTCPHLDWTFSLEKDTAGQLFRLKQEIFSQIDPDVVVSTDYMKDMVTESGTTRHFQRIHKIPFGINLSVFYDRENREALQRKRGIPEGSIVIGFLAAPAINKGLSSILSMLTELEIPGIRCTLLTVGQPGLLRSVSRRYQVVELGYLEQEQDMADFYNTCDLFLMPSQAESFGLMAIEAMACSRPVIVSNTPALMEVTNAPDCGVSVDPQDATAFAAAVKRLALDEGERKERGRKARQLTEERYNVEVYHQRMLDLYKSILDRN